MARDATTIEAELTQLRSVRAGGVSSIRADSWSMDFAGPADVDRAIARLERELLLVTGRRRHTMLLPEINRGLT